ncbi:MAG: 16S rRNA (cytosine(967)-C(5))-methyltransferase RsmB [Eubacteriales bacterium]|nr:16S rRNA (cytosine(967)-C(5))-methyltransferase RsmB [Eubacteriales bacterium]
MQENNRGEKKSFSGEKRNFSKGGSRRGSFSKGREDSRGKRPYAKDGDKKPYRKDGEKDFKKPFRKDGEKDFKKPFRRDGERDFTMRNGGKPRFDRKSDSKKNDKPYTNRFELQPKEEEKGVSLARLTAFRIIQDVTVRGAYTALALNEVLKVNELPDVDKRLCTNIVYTTIENLIRLDYIIDAHMEKPSYEPALRDVLRMSVAQLLFMDKIPSFAVINEGVKLMRIVSIVETWAGVVNGVLRNIVRHQETFEWPKEEENLPLYLSVMHSMPVWLVNKFIATFGEEKAKEIISYTKKDNRTCIRPNLMHISKEKFEAMLIAKGWDFEKGLVEGSYLIKNIDSIAEDEDYIKGNFSVQGQSSMLAAMAVENTLGMTVLDACAAPGGKTFFMAEKQQGSGRVYSWDIHNHRVDLIRQSMYRLSPGNVRVAVCDASKYREDMFEYFDRVLIDAPCSNLGVMQEKPDVKYNVKEEEMQSLLDTQYKILENCAKYLKVGGILVYSTCSIMPEENEVQVAKFLANHKEYSALPMPASFPAEMQDTNGGIGLSIFAHTSGLEGFYIARLQKNA